MSVLNLQVGAESELNTDDATERASTGEMNLTASVYFGNISYGRNPGMRFTGVSGLSGATINSATLTFRAAVSDSGTFVGDWYAEDGASPGTFTSATSDITNRSKTTATCEGDSGDFGPWTIGQDYTFTGDGVNTIADIIQELADAYDPSAIVMMHFFAAGAGERIAKSYDSDTSLAPKLDITFEAAGGVEVTPSALAYGWSIPTPTFSPQTATFTPSALAYGWAFPAPVIVAGVLVEPSALAYGWSIPTPTWSGITTYTPDALAYGWAIPIPSVVAGVSITPTVLAYGWAIPTPTFSPQVVTFTPTAVSYGWAIPTPTISVGLVSYPAEGRSLTTRFVDVSKYPDDALYYMEVVMVTSSALVPAYARLWNITDDIEVQDSEVSDNETDETAVEPVRSSALTLSGTKRYRAEFGGEPGSEIRPIAWDMVVVTS